MLTPVFRFAPSPNGRLHLGHAFSALLNQRMARESGGRLLLRIEDTDVTRCKPRFTRHILEDLAWLGIHWEDPPRIQSEHFADYKSALEALWSDGVIYPCFCSRKVAASQAKGGSDPDGQPLYAGTCRMLVRSDAEARLRLNKSHGWRLKTENSSASHWGDVILAKPDTGSWYHIAVVVDDALQGITHVVRGTDLEAATVIHRHLQKLLGLPTPQYHHHHLIQDPIGQKLSKSLKSQSLASLRDEGVTAADIRQHLGFD